VSGTTVREQRCLLHTRRNAADTCREERTGEANKETRKQLMKQACAMYQAESAQEAWQRLTAVAEQWRAQTPKAVATLEHDCEQASAFCPQGVSTRAHPHHLAVGAHQP
jgi:transposase-like protein